MLSSIEEEINAITEPTKVILSTMTEVKLNKKSKASGSTNPFTKVYKLQKSIVELNVNYEDRKNQLLVESGQEATFKSSGLPWGTNIDNHWVEHNGTRYLKVIEDSKLGEPVYVQADTNNELVQVDKSAFEEFLPSSSPRPESDVNFRMYQLPSIINIEPYETTN